MIPTGRSTGRRRARKRAISQESEGEGVPLRAKPTNIRKRSGFDKNIRFLGDTNSVGGSRVDKYMKQNEGNKNVVFASDHVSIRLGDAEQEQGSEQEPDLNQQRLIITSPNTSLQISDFDVPPESTSTPLPSPDKQLSSLSDRSEGSKAYPMYHSTNYRWNRELYDGADVIGQRMYSPVKSTVRYHEPAPGKYNDKLNGKSYSSDDVQYDSSAANATYYGSESTS